MSEEKIEKKSKNTPGILKPDEPHPSASIAMEYMKSIPYDRLIEYVEIFSNKNLEENRLSEICSETLKKYMHNEPVSDRYFLGLSWAILYFEQKRTVFENISLNKKMEQEKKNSRIILLNGKRS